MVIRSITLAPSRIPACSWPAICIDMVSGIGDERGNAVAVRGAGKLTLPFYRLLNQQLQARAVSKPDRPIQQHITASSAMPDAQETKEASNAKSKLTEKLSCHCPSLRLLPTLP